MINNSWIQYGLCTIIVVFVNKLEVLLWYTIKCLLLRLDFPNLRNGLPSPFSLKLGSRRPKVSDRRSLICYYLESFFDGNTVACRTPLTFLGRMMLRVVCMKSLLCLARIVTVSKITTADPSLYCSLLRRKNLYKVPPRSS